MTKRHLATLMPRLLAAWLFALLGCVVAENALAARKALVVGVSGYDPGSGWSRLNNARHDAEAMAKRLRAIGFEVRERWLVIDGKRDDIDNAIGDFLGDLRPGDEAVMFFSGHGVQVGGASLFIPRDMPDVTLYPGGQKIPPERIADAEDMLRRRGVDLAALAQRVALRAASRVGPDDERGFSLLIVDACRDNPVVDNLVQMHARSPEKSFQPPPKAGANFNPDPATRNQVLWFSARSGQTSLDRLSASDPVRNGVFTRVLLQELDNPDRPLRELLNAVERHVPELARQYLNPRTKRPHEQNPVSHASANRAEFNFARGVVTSSPVATVPVDPEDEAWQAAKRRDTVTSYKAYLGMRPANPP